MVLENWVLLALGAMIFLSVSNLMLKIISSNPSLFELDITTLIPVLLIIGIGIIALVYQLTQKIPSLGLTPWIMLLFATAGVIAMVFALRQGKVAIVTAILSLSTVFVAILSAVFLGDKFTGREIAAMLLALLSLLVLVLN